MNTNLTIKKDGSLRPLSVAVGERVLLPEFGGQKIKLGEEEYDLYRDAEFLGKFEVSHTIYFKYN